MTLISLETCFYKPVTANYFLFVEKRSKQTPKPETKKISDFPQLLNGIVKTKKKVVHEYSAEANCKICTIKIKRPVMSINKSFKQAMFWGC